MICASSVVPLASVTLRSTTRGEGVASEGTPLMVPVDTSRLRPAGSGSLPGINPYVKGGRPPAR